MTPLHVTATLDGGGLTVTDGGIALDSLVMWAEAQRRQLPPPGFGPLVDIEIPIAREPGGRFFLASWAYPAWEGHERRFVNRKFPLHEAQIMAGPKLRRIHVGAGAQKSYRIPTQVSFPAGGVIEWWCVGDAEPLRDLLACVTHLGRRRAVGRGRVRAWAVAACEPWGDGFPVVRDGVPTRPLPIDWPGVESAERAARVLAPPYWAHERAELCAVPA